MNYQYERRSTQNVLQKFTVKIILKNNSYKGQYVFEEKTSQVSEVYTSKVFDGKTDWDVMKLIIFNANHLIASKTSAANDFTDYVWKTFFNSKQPMLTDKKGVKL
jgi:hypothetical protein